MIELIIGLAVGYVLFGGSERKGNSDSSSSPSPSECAADGEEYDHIDGD